MQSLSFDWLFTNMSHFNIGTKEDIVSVGCLSTPEVSPEKSDEPIAANLDFQQPIKSEPTQSSSDTSTDSKELTGSASHTSASSNGSLTDAKPKRRGRTVKV